MPISISFIYKGFLNLEQIKRPLLKHPVFIFGHFYTTIFIVSRINKINNYYYIFKREITVDKQVWKGFNR